MLLDRIQSSEEAKLIDLRYDDTKWPTTDSVCSSLNRMSTARRYQSHKYCPFACVVNAFALILCSFLQDVLISFDRKLTQITQHMSENVVYSWMKLTKSYTYINIISLLNWMKAFIIVVYAPFSSRFNFPQFRQLPYWAVPMYTSIRAPPSTWRVRWNIVPNRQHTFSGIIMTR